MALARASLLLPALLTAAVLVLWLPGERPPTTQQPRPPSDADYYMERFQLLQSDAQGRARHWLRAVHLAQYGDITHLRQPELVLRGDEGAVPWRLRADTGRLEQESRVFLQGEVQIQRLNTGERPGLRILTPSLRLDLERKIAETAQAVTVLAPQGQLQARGLRLSLQEQRLQLLAQVRGTYAQP